MKIEENITFILEKEIEQIESSISAILKQMEKEREIQLLQELHHEANRLELRRDEIYEKLEKIEGD
ncbi:hypothetical protein AN964_23850 [Heyndrickxia shackletonii]|uniref:Uncharacterized protein n=1 Tax=Heyndrickxia shackletonii TaxID=157838 RepID=A0A0Q3T9F5_9BACI|nr:hypothetical protein AN964_23850 [Heyndrickxia shackletonii]NEY97999.1 hypothetical protein [Heyndrickxia shackletonii]